MAIEKTLVLLKPCTLQRALVGEIISIFEKKGLHPNDALLLLTANGRSLSDNIRYFRHICHAPLTIGTFLVSAGAAVITPQRRFTRAPQGSPQVFRRP